MRQGKCKAKASSQDESSHANRVDGADCSNGHDKGVDDEKRARFV